MILSRKDIINLARELDGECHYSGKDKTMYVTFYSKRSLGLFRKRRMHKPSKFIIKPMLSPQA